MVVENFNYIKKNEVETLPYILYEILTQNVNKRIKTVKLLEWIKKEKLYDIRFDNNFLDMTLKA